MCVSVCECVCVSVCVLVQCETVQSTYECAQVRVYDEKSRKRYVLRAPLTDFKHRQLFVHFSTKNFANRVPCSGFENEIDVCVSIVYDVRTCAVILICAQGMKNMMHTL